MLIFVIVFSILALDQISKFFVSAKIQLNDTLPVIKGVFGLSLIHNRGAAFGIFKNQVYLFIVTSLAAVVLIYFGLKDNRHNKYYVVSLSLILAGALGNLIDRVRFGYVIDFLNFYIWPVFNVADSAVTVGAVLLGWTILKQK
ncbi:MAG: signal peptidase II [Candidatus Omnitrophota bacterium]